LQSARNDELNLRGQLGQSNAMADNARRSLIAARSSYETSARSTLLHNRDRILEVIAQLVPGSGTVGFPLGVENGPHAVASRSKFYFLFLSLFLPQNSLLS
jgi:hypothetical protein